MEIIIRPDYAALSDEAAGIVLAEVRRKPDLALGLATGRTPLGLYERLRASRDAFARVRFFNLDEFHGLSADDRWSFRRALREQLLDHVAHDKANVHLFRGDAPDLEAEAEEVERKIGAAGGIDVQILGLGRNGHLGFNEPGSSLGSRTRVKTLQAETLADHMQTLDSQARLTSFVVTMGIGTILESRRILLLASGSDKAEIVRQMVEGPVTAEVPASALQLHPRTSVVVDEAAAAALKRRDYWKWVYENRWRVGQGQVRR